MVKKISISEEAYWKLKEMQAKLRCSTWNELADRLWLQLLGSDEMGGHRQVIRRGEHQKHTPQTWARNVDEEG